MTHQSKTPGSTIGKRALRIVSPLVLTAIMLALFLVGPIALQTTDTPVLQRFSNLSSLLDADLALAQTGDMTLTKKVVSDFDPALGSPNLWVAPGGVVTYTLNLTNNGSSGVTFDITDTLAADLTCLTVGFDGTTGTNWSTNDGACTNSASWSSSTDLLAAGNSAVLTFTAQVDSGAVPGTQIVNDNITLLFANSNIDVSAAATITVAGPVISLTKTAASPTATVGGPIVYTINLTNTGVLTLTPPYTIEENIPLDTTYDSAGFVGPLNGTVNAPGSTADVEWVVTSGPDRAERRHRPGGLHRNGGQ
jgi:fimbrial isopeptide formation D2 family protein/uncharacterized repeat protein (TIGR01451 family)